MTRQPAAMTRRRLAASRRCAVVLGVLAALSMPMPMATALTRAGPGPVTFAAPLPLRPIIAQGVSSANPAHLVRDRAWDFAEMAKTFDTVSLLPGDPTAVRQARAAGLSVVLELDFKSYFFSGEDISAKVDAVVQQITAAPGTVVAVSVADRVNEKYSPEEALRYLAATAGVLHRQVPGMPVVVNVADWELTCGRPNQSACNAHDPRFQYETHKVLDILYRSGYVDGFTIADNLKNDDLQAQRAAWAEARTRWPAPFILWSTCSQLSFPENRYPGTPDSAARVAEAYMAAPMEGGADGLALWAWHQLYDGAVYSFLDKSGSPNSLWTAMVAAARELRQPSHGPTVVSPAVGAGAAPDRSTVPAARKAGSSIAIGLWSAIGFLLIAGVLGGGCVARARQRARGQLEAATTRHVDLARVRDAQQRRDEPSTWR
ncbi:MAG: hypothetical protein QOJ11_137 [Frankiales bacterium]|jgi:hypothetical protein|nr:hypothetical protein [Frankiales bacterium]